MTVSYFQCSNSAYYDARRYSELVLCLPEGCDKEVAERELAFALKHNDDDLAKGQRLKLDCGAEAVVTWTDSDVELVASLEPTGGIDLEVAEQPLPEAAVAEAFND